MRKPNEKNPEPPLTFGAPRHLDNVTVILVEPAVPGNIGSAARAMTTMGLTDLVVLNGPKDFRTHMQTIMLGHGAGDLLKRARAVSTWEEATEGLHWLVGTTPRKRRPQFPQVVEAREAVKKIVELTHKHRVGIVFGREEAGLSDVELRLCHDIVSVPQACEHPSLNLSQAVVLLSYEIYFLSDGARSGIAFETPADVAGQDRLPSASRRPSIIPAIPPPRHCPRPAGKTRL